MHFLSWAADTHLVNPLLWEKVRAARSTTSHFILDGGSATAQARAHSRSLYSGREASSGWQPGWQR